MWTTGRISEGRIMVTIQGADYPDHLYYDIDNQIWYEPLADGTLRAGFTPWATALMGDVLVFMPKRLGHAFEKERSFAIVEGGKWVGAARAGFDGVMVAHNDALIDRPNLLNDDAFGTGWMVIVRPSREDWYDGLVTAAAIAPAFDAWLRTEAHKGRSG
jgi:glycine cleavage system H protein